LLSIFHVFILFSRGPNDSRNSHYVPPLAIPLPFHTATTSRHVSPMSFKFFTLIPSNSAQNAVTIMTATSASQSIVSADDQSKQ
jgi:hypothetical protein